MIFKGKVFKFGDHINTDDIIPARYLNSSDPNELAQHLMEDFRSGFGRRQDLKGSIIVAGETFGCGSSREHAPAAIKAAGIVCVIAQSFARIFMRNSINIGLPVIEIESTSEFNEDDLVELDIHAGKAFNHSKKKEFRFGPYPSDLQEIFLAGGWLEYISKGKNTDITEYFRKIAQFPYKRENIRL